MSDYQGSVSTSADLPPDAPHTGAVMRVVEEHRTVVWDGAAWVDAPDGVAPFANTPAGTPYVIGSDVVGQYPEVSHSLADRIDNRHDDAINQARATSIQKSGDQMSGALHVPGGLYFQDAGMAYDSGSGHEASRRWVTYWANGQARYMWDANWRLMVYAVATSSTQRFKTDVQKATTDTPDLSRITPSSFVWTENPWDVTAPGVRYGLIAEEVAQVDERLVTRDENGDVAGLDTHALIAALVQKVNELTARVEALESK